MKKIFLFLILLLVLSSVSSCEGNKEALKLKAFDEVLQERLSETIVMDGTTILLDKYIFLSSSDHPNITDQSGSFNMYYTFDKELFSSETVKGWGGSSVKLTLKEKGLKENSYETYITCTASTLSGSFTKTVRRKVVVPSWEYCVGQIYIGARKNIESFENKGKDGFYLHTQTVSSGHYYTDYIVELNIPNKEIKYTVYKYHKDTDGTHNHTSNDAIYNYGNQTLLINGTQIQISTLAEAEYGTLEAALRGLIRDFDSIFNNIGFYEYVSCLS